MVELGPEGRSAVRVAFRLTVTCTRLAFKAISHTAVGSQWPSPAQVSAPLWFHHYFYVLASETYYHVL